MEGGLIEQTGQAGRTNDEIKLSVMGHEQIIREKGVEKSQSLVNRKQAGLAVPWMRSWLSTARSSIVRRVRPRWGSAANVAVP